MLKLLQTTKIKRIFIGRFTPGLRADGTIPRSGEISAIMLLMFLMLLIYRIVDADGDDGEELTDIQTNYIVPVELNSFLCRNSRIMAEFYESRNNIPKAQEYRGYEQEFKVK